ncbi:unnamed protein product [Euphydryas editha]|uniref:FP protein C-terminal domain-containing protein n=1 Tax=Euphydryas editha TaxID=104508 RepID=A0AAU9VAF4_EUPED|nr:unnamed protein product [Euphydryas editha]
MPNIQRSPPLNSSMKSSSRSESDLSTPTTSASCFTKNDTNITTRSKRQRMETCSPNASTSFASNTGDLRTDLLNMLSNWKEDQDRRLNEWKSSLDDTLSKLVSEVTHLKNECREMRRTNAEIERGMEFINNIQEETSTKIKQIENDQKETTNTINKMESQIKNIQFHTRDSTIEIRNIPISSNEKFDNLLSILSTIGKTVEMTIKSGDIRDIYRLPGKPGVLRPIVAEFTCVHSRNELLSRVRKFNKEKPVPEKLNTQVIGLPGAKKPIYIEEHLGPAQRKLMFQTRQFAKKYNYSCWHSNARILLRMDSSGKPIIIDSEKCLSDLEKKS